MKNSKNNKSISSVKNVTPHSDFINGSFKLVHATILSGIISDNNKRRRKMTLHGRTPEKIRKNNHNDAASVCKVPGCWQGECVTKKGNREDGTW